MKLPKSHDNDGDEMFRLRWESNNGAVDLGSSLKDFRENEELFDVKLGCSIPINPIKGVANDGTVLLRAHKLVLAAFSPVFKDIFERLKDNVDPFIFLKGISGENLSSMLDFMYTGSVDILKSSLNSFLSDAEELQIKGLKFYNEMDSKLEQLGSRQERGYDWKSYDDTEDSKKPLKHIKKRPVKREINLDDTISDTESDAEKAMDEDYNASSTKRELKRGKRGPYKKTLEKLQAQVKNSLQDQLEDFEVSQMDSFPIETKEEKNTDVHPNSNLKTFTEIDMTALETSFEKVPADRWLTRGDGKKRSLSRCKICTKEIRSDKRKNHLLVNHCQKQTQPKMVGHSDEQ